MSDWRSYIYNRAASKVKNAGNNIKGKLDQAKGTAKKVVGDIGRATRKGQVTNQGAGHKHVALQYSPTIKTVDYNEQKMFKYNKKTDTMPHQIIKGLTEGKSGISNLRNDSKLLKSHRKTIVTNASDIRSGIEPYEDHTYTPNYTKTTQKRKAKAQYEASKKQSAERSAHYAKTEGGKREATRNAISNYEKKRKRTQKLGTTRKKNVTSGSVSVSKSKRK